MKKIQTSHLRYLAKGKEMDSLMSHFDALKKKISEFNPEDLISDTATILGNIQPSTIIDLNSLSENEHLPVIIVIVSLMIIFSLVKKTICEAWYMVC